MSENNEICEGFFSPINFCSLYKKWVGYGNVNFRVFRVLVTKLYEIQGFQGPLVSFQGFQGFRGFQGPLDTLQWLWTVQKHLQIHLPPELQVKCEHEGQHATFLELDITIENGMFVYKLFDKRDDFPFSIVRMPDLSGNIPDHIFYGSVMSEFLRIARATLRYSDFVPKARDLFHRMVHQNGDKHKLLLQLKKAITRHTQYFRNFQKSTEDILKDIDNWIICITFYFNTFLLYQLN